jgi:hypothetical protein
MSQHYWDDKTQAWVKAPSELDRILDYLHLIHQDVLAIHALLAQQQPPNRLGALPVQSPGDVGVGGSGDLDGGVAQALRYDDEGDTRFQRGDDIGVPGVVGPNAGQAGDGGANPQEAAVELIDGDGEDAVCEFCGKPPSECWWPAYTLEKRKARTRQGHVPRPPLW